MKPILLITGGSGFIGSHLVDRLNHDGYEIVVVDNYKTGRIENIKPSDSLTIAKGDISDFQFLDFIFNKFRPLIVVHAAASFHNPSNWEDDINTNILGTVNVVRLSKKYKIVRLIYLQTSLSYGLKPLQNPISLNHPLFSGGYSGGSSYAISKTAGELYIELSGIEYISFRLANTYGPRNLSGPLPVFFKNLSNGDKVVIVNSKRDFIYIDDLISCLVKAIEGFGNRGHYHLGTGHEYSINYLFELVVKNMNIGLIQNNLIQYRDLEADDVASILLDISKTEKDFSWFPKTPIEVGVNHTIEWYKNNAVNRTYTHLNLFQ